MFNKLLKNNNTTWESKIQLVSVMRQDIIVGSKNIK